MLVRGFWSDLRSLWEQQRKFLVFCFAVLDHAPGVGGCRMNYPRKFQSKRCITPSLPANRLSFRSV